MSKVLEKEKKKGLEFMYKKQNLILDKVVPKTVCGLLKKTKKYFFVGLRLLRLSGFF